VAQLRHLVPEVDSAGVQLHAVGCGSVQQLNWFIEDQNFDKPAFTDPTGKVYAAAEMVRGRKIFGLRALKNFWRMFRAGFRQDGVRGDGLQNGGVLLVKPKGDVAYRFIAEQFGDHAPVERVRAAVLQLAP
jgi:hypothetical protein